MIAHLYYKEDTLCGVNLESVPRIGETIMLSGPVVHEVEYLAWKVIDVRHILSSKEHKSVYDGQQGVAIHVIPHIPEPLEGAAE